MKIKRILASGVFLTTLTAQAATTQPSCSNMLGSWVNELGSTMNISSINPTTNFIEGTYSSPTGTSGQKFKLVGWINHLPPHNKENNAHVIAFSVQWGQYGSITSWTGICTNKNNTPTIKTIWNLVRSNSQFEWDHIITNSDTFIPK